MVNQRQLKGHADIIVCHETWMQRVGNFCVGQLLKITLSGEWMQVLCHLMFLDRDTQLYVYIFMRCRHCVYEFHWHRLKLLISTLMKMGNIFHALRRYNIKELSELFHYDHALLYAETWTNLLRSISLLINLGNCHSFNSLLELDCQLRNKLLRATAVWNPEPRRTKYE